MAEGFSVFVTQLKDDDSVSGTIGIGAAMVKTIKSCAHAEYTTDWKGLEFLLPFKPAHITTNTPVIVAMTAKAYILWQMQKLFPEHKAGVADISRRDGRTAYQKIVIRLFDTVVPDGNVVPRLCESVDTVCDGVIRAPAQRHVLDFGDMPKITVCAACYDKWKPIDVQPLCGWYGAIMAKWAEIEHCPTVLLPSSVDEPNAKKIKLAADAADAADTTPP